MTDEDVEQKAKEWSNSHEAVTIRVAYTGDNPKSERLAIQKLQGVIERFIAKKTFPKPTGGDLIVLSIDVSRPFPSDIKEEEREKDELFTGS